MYGDASVQANFEGRETQTDTKGTKSTLKSYRVREACAQTCDPARQVCLRSSVRRVVHRRAPSCVARTTLQHLTASTVRTTAQARARGLGGAVLCVDAENLSRTSRRGQDITAAICRTDPDSKLYRSDALDVNNNTMALRGHKTKQQQPSRKQQGERCSCCSECAQQTRLENCLLEQPGT